MNRPLIVTLLTFVMCATPALAQQRAAKAPAAADDATRARDLFQAAQKLYKQSRYAEAIARFEEALAVKPHPVIHFNIARCYEQLGEPARALRSYRDYLRLLPEAKDRQVVSESIASLERKLREKGLQQLLVLAQPEGARVEVDGKDLGRAPASIELVAGEHKLVVKADGYETFERTFNFTTTRSTEQNVTLVKAVMAPPPTAPPMVDAPRRDEPLALTPSSSPGATGVSQTVAPAKKGRVFTWVAAGVAVAAAGTAGVLVPVGFGKAATIQDGTQRTRPELDAIIGESNGMVTGGWVAAGVAGAALVTAVVLFFVEGS